MRRVVAPRDVVVTGIGCVTPLGVGLETCWEAALAGRSGVGPLSRFDSEGYPARIAAEAPADLDLSDVPEKEARRLDRAIALAVVAAREAVSGAKLEIDDANRTRVGVAVGSGIGGLETLERSIEALIRSGPRRVQPFTIPMATWRSATACRAPTCAT